MSSEATREVMERRIIELEEAHARLQLDVEQQKRTYEARIAKLEDKLKRAGELIAGYRRTSADPKV